MRILAAITAALLLLGCSKHGKRDGDSSSWSGAKVGAVYESRTVTHLERPFVHETETTMRQTLVAKTDAAASIQLEVTEGAATSTHQLEIPLRPDVMPPTHDGSSVTTAQEMCVVPAGTFECTRTTVEVHQGDATHSTSTWTAKQIPVPIKSVVTNENMTITTELVAVR
jgi:hypothetical protein